MSRVGSSSNRALTRGLAPTMSPAPTNDTLRCPLAAVVDPASSCSSSLVSWRMPPAADPNRVPAEPAWRYPWMSLTATTRSVRVPAGGLATGVIDAASGACSMPTRVLEDEELTGTTRRATRAAAGTSDRAAVLSFMPGYFQGDED
jgi:hypothetical protein